MLNRTLIGTSIWLGMLALPACGGVIIASGAGPSLPTAENLTRTQVTEIVGDFGLNSNDAGVNLFEIDIQNTTLFSAITTYTGAYGVPDPELFLFDQNGFGIAFNDDISAANTQSCLPSLKAGATFCNTFAGAGPKVPGLYYLGIAYSANGPVDVHGNEIFTNVLSTDVVGPNAGAGALAGFDGNSFTQPDSDLTGYDITLSGVSAVPEPSNYWLVVLLVISVTAFWRQRSSVRS